MLGSSGTGAGQGLVSVSTGLRARNKGRSSLWRVGLRQNWVKDLQSSEDGQDQGLGNLGKRC